MMSVYFTSGAIILGATEGRRNFFFKHSNNTLSFIYFGVYFSNYRSRVATRSEITYTYSFKIHPPACQTHYAQDKKKNFFSGTPHEFRDCGVLCCLTNLQK
jgi:hypothetical protein